MFRVNKILEWFKAKLKEDNTYLQKKVKQYFKGIKASFGIDGTDIGWWWGGGIQPNKLRGIKLVKINFVKKNSKQNSKIAGKK